MITDIFILGTTSNFKNFDNCFQKYNIKPTIYINIPKFYKSNYYFHLFKSYFYFYVPWFFMSIKKLLSLLCFGSFLICFIEINYYKNNYIHSQMTN